MVIARRSIANAANEKKWKFETRTWVIAAEFCKLVTLTSQSIGRILEFTVPCTKVAHRTKPAMCVIGLRNARSSLSDDRKILAPISPIIIGTRNSPFFTRLLTIVLVREITSSCFSSTEMVDTRVDLVFNNKRLMFYVTPTINYSSFTLIQFLNYFTVIIHAEKKKT